MEVLLDANFIISCILKRIDFLGELRGLGFKVIVPREVLQELKDLKKEGRTSYAERKAIDIAFSMLEGNKVKKMKLGGKNVDEGLIRIGREGAYIATLDRGIKVHIPNKIVILSSKNRLDVVRD